MDRIFRFALTTFVVCSASLLTAGPAAAIDVCGNGICNTTTIPRETPTNCPADCGGGPVTPPCLIDTCDQGSCSPSAAGVDRDGDSLPDLLEHQLAQQFFPVALLQWASVDRDESYLFSHRATPYTVQPYLGNSTLCDVFTECLEVRWAIAFFRDHGDTFDGGHLGDSEMYAALLRRNPFWSGSPTDPAAWEMIRDFTAAHWGTASDSSRVGNYGYCPEPCNSFDTNSPVCNSHSACKASGQCTGHSVCASQSTEADCVPRGCTWTPSCIGRFSWKCYSILPMNGAVALFCAESKHGLYHTDSECDNGAFWSADECPNNAFDLSSQRSGLLQNVGSLGSHALFDTTIQDPKRCGLYDVWGGAKFGEATSYRQNLTAPLNWALD